MTKKIKIILISIISILTIAVGVLGYKVYKLEQDLEIACMTIDTMTKTVHLLVEGQSEHTEMIEKVFKQVDFITRSLGGKFQ